MIKPLPQDPNAWQPLAWLEEPLQEHNYLDIRIGDEFMQAPSPYSTRQAFRSYVRAELAARRSSDITHQSIRAALSFIAVSFGGA